MHQHYVAPGEYPRAHSHPHAGNRLLQAPGYYRQPVTKGNQLLQATGYYRQPVITGSRLLQATGYYRQPVTTGNKLLQATGYYRQPVTTSSRLLQATGCYRQPVTTGTRTALFAILALAFRNSPWSSCWAAGSREAYRIFQYIPIYSQIFGVGGMGGALFY